MDKAQKARRPVRASFTKTFNLFMAEKANAEPDMKNLQIHAAKMERLLDELSALDQQICDLLLDSDCSDVDYAAERHGIEEYVDKIDQVRIELKAMLNLENCESIIAQSVISSQTQEARKKKFKLPKLEFITFGGEIHEWLGFWSQFQKIHDDDEIPPEDKFQYLIQAMAKESRARDVVCSFPPTASNYPKAIESLKSRFGRDDLLVEVYVRELLKLVILNASSHTDKSGMPKLYDKLESHLRALDSIGVTSDKYAAMLFPLMESCLPEDILRAWQRSTLYSTQTKGPAEGSEVTDKLSKSRLSILMDFLRNEVEGEQRITLARAGFDMSDGHGPKKAKKKAPEVKEGSVPTATSLLTGDKKSDCLFCEKPHESKECFHAQKMTLDEKKVILSKKKCCYICFKSGHSAKFCRASIRCIVCGKKHLVMMCPDLPNHKNQEDAKSKPEEKEKEVPSKVLSNMACTQTVALQTVMVVLKGKTKERVIRAIIDTASQQSYILERCVAEMGFKPLGTKDMIHGLFGGVESKKQSHSLFQISLCSLKRDFECQMNVWDQPVICGSLPRVKMDKWYQELKSKRVWLTDMGDGEAEIELLIGADVAGKLMTGCIHQLSCGLTAVETKLGWTVMGKMSGQSVKNSSAALMVTSLFITEASLADIWKLDTIGILDPVEAKTKADREMEALRHFQDTVKLVEGRYEVALPFIEGHPEVPNNRALAEKRLVSATKKLVNAGQLELYQSVLQEWLKEEIIEVVPGQEVQSFGHYLPHRGVFKEHSTTKVRPVFDASARFNKSPSLNDCLEKGPNLIELIPALMARFRKGRIGITSDIRKAFLQISVRKEDRDYLRFLWWKGDAQEEIQVLRHRRVVFGVNCSPFLLGAVLNLHLESAPPLLKATAIQLQESLYVDNCVASVDTHEEAQRFMVECTKLLSTANFELRGWEISEKLACSEDKMTPILGMFWDRNRDELSCAPLGNVDVGGPYTKRRILSLVQKVFDPLGFTCPVTLFPKCLLQETWKMKIGWDDELPAEMNSRFELWAKDLKHLSDIRIPRHLMCDIDNLNSSFHVFCDASKIAYAATVFLRSESQGNTCVQLVQAKSRVAPLKECTIPRLELLACTIGSRLAATVVDSLHMGNVPIYYWSDSTTALCWIKRKEQWGTFVANRVKQICSLTKSEAWRHIPGEQNPADLPSRGCSIKYLRESRWWEGPHWLKLDKTQWPTSVFDADEEEIYKEKRKGIVSSLVATDEKVKWYMRYYSEYHKVLRLVAWVLRFFMNARCRPQNRAYGELNITELENAEKHIVKLVQKEVFGEDRISEFKSLCVFEDCDGMLRIKTGIGRRNDLETFRSPILLPSHHPLIEALVRDEHLRLCHAGTQILMGNLRQKFWIVKSRRTIRSVIQKCQRCRRFDAKRVVAIPAELPAERVTDSYVFEVTGVDLAGPLILRSREKAWIVLYTCAVYRAIHLELVVSLSTDGFLQSLRRFIARRGRPGVVYSDNGTNFTGASHLFDSLDQKRIEEFASLQRIRWKFIPPTAAWWGGWWERLIRMVKDLLRRVLGRSSLTYEEMMTLLCDCEAVINTRPLTYMSEDPEDLSPLTPAMFLQGVQESIVPELEVLDATSARKRHQYRQRLMKNLRTRFRTEYLGQLVLRKGQKGDHRPVQVGDVVLIGSDHTKRLNWPMGKVLEVYPGKDGSVRVVRLKTATGILTRPIQRIYQMELTGAESSTLKKKMESGLPTKVAATTEVLRTRYGRAVKAPAKFTP